MGKLYIYLFVSATGQFEELCSFNINTKYFTKRNTYHEFSTMLFDFLRNRFLTVKGDHLIACTQQPKNLNYIPRSIILFELSKAF